MILTSWYINTSPTTKLRSGASRQNWLRNKHNQHHRNDLTFPGPSQPKFCQMNIINVPTFRKQSSSSSPDTAKGCRKSHQSLAWQLQTKMAVMELLLKFARENGLVLLLHSKPLINWMPKLNKPSYIMLKLISKLGIDLFSQQTNWSKPLKDNKPNQALPIVRWGSKNIGRWQWKYCFSQYWKSSWKLKAKKLFSIWLIICNTPMFKLAKNQSILLHVQLKNDQYS